MTPTTEQEEILNKHVSLYFSSHHDKSQWNGEGEHGGAEWHTNKAIAADIYKAMDEFGRQQSIAFFKWYGIRMASFLEYITKVQPICKSEEMEEAILKHEGATFEQLYSQFIENQFIEQQNKP